ncbi:hypothetical protein [Nocardia sp. CA-290969]|uniref:hypothetical protein n=1 Tax=Nocardia sp. CA-290969 TaxID=3239986 RepID=UPI003D8B34B5
MSLVTQLSDLATRVGTEFKAVRTTIGSLASLSTTDKTNIVAAINEVAAGGGAGGPVTSEDITDSTTVGRAVLTAVDAAAARTAVGAKASTWLPTAADISDSTATGRALITAASATAARSALSVYSTGETDSAIATQVAALVEDAPETLNTIAEIAAALGNNPDAIANIQTALGNRVRVDTASQGLTTTQQGNARTNIGAAAAADVGDTSTDFVAVFEAALV